MLGKSLQPIQIALSGPCRDNDTFDGCFWWQTVDVEYQSSVAICGEEKSKPAIIETEAMYEQVVDDVRKGISKVTSKAKAKLWTGMTFDPEVTVFDISGRR